MEKVKLIRLARSIIDEETNRKIILNKHEEYFADPTKDFFIKKLKIPKETLQQPGKHQIGKDTIIIHKPFFIDTFTNLKKVAQTITQKDIATIIAFAGITKESKIIDAGLGSASLAGYLAKIAKQVVSYEINPRHLKQAQKNLDLLGSKITIKQESIYEANPKQEFDVFTLDVPQPWNALKTADKALKQGGYLVSYSPNLTQTQKVIANLPPNFVHENTIETINRYWHIDEKRLRPKTQDFSHTAFISFIRKVY